MSDYARMVSSQLKWTLFLLVAIAIGAGITPYTRVFLSLLLGGLVSLFNLWLLQRKVNAFGKAVSEKGKAMSLGTFTRVLTSVLVVLIALKFEATFHIYSVVIGLVISYVVLMINLSIEAVHDMKHHDHPPG